MDRKTAGNMGFAIAGLTCFVETFVVGESVVLRMSGSAYSPRHRKPPKRCTAFCICRKQNSSSFTSPTSLLLVAPSFDFNNPMMKGLVGYEKLPFPA